MKNLRKIFTFYSEQHMPIKNTLKMTFEQIEFKKNAMTQSAFLKFCKDFEIPIKRDQQ
jgi:hypothetical protein